MTTVLVVLTIVVGVMGQLLLGKLHHIQRQLHSFQIEFGWVSESNSICWTGLRRHFGANPRITVRKLSTTRRDNAL